MTGQLRNLTGTAMVANHEERIRDLERKLNAKQTNLAARRPVPGGGKEYMTFVVAAVNSSDHGKASADYVCDGVDDQVEINAALGIGFDGGVLLLEGEYEITDDIRVTTGWTLRGVGPGSAIYRHTGAGSNAIVQIGTSLVCDLKIHDNTGTFVGVFAFGDDCVTERLYIEDFDLGIQVNGRHQLVRGNLIFNPKTTGILDDAIGSNSFEGNILANGLGNGIVCDAPSSTFVGNHVEAFSGDGIRIDAQHVLVAANRVHQCVGHGIYLLSATDAVVSSNQCFSNGDFHPFGDPPTHDNIHIDGADACSVQGNLCRRGAYTRYGIGIGAAATNNLVTNNDLHNGGNTANFSDAGTGTVTTAGNRL